MEKENTCTIKERKNMAKRYFKFNFLNFPIDFFLAFLGFSSKKFFFQI